MLIHFLKVYKNSTCEELHNGVTSDKENYIKRSKAKVTCSNLFFTHVWIFKRFCQQKQKSKLELLILFKKKLMD